MRLKWVSWLLMIVLLLGACQAQGTEEVGQETAPEETDTPLETETNGEGANYPLTVTDDSGEEVVLEQEPQKIVTVLPSATEIAFALGLEEEIIAVTENDDYPEQVQEKETVGGMELNIEKIVELDPDLVLAGLLNGEAVQKMRDLGLTVLVSEGQDLEGTFKSIELIGHATNRHAEAETIVNRMQEEIQQVQEQTADITQEERVDVWLEVDPELFTAGSGTMMDEIIALAGGNNIAAEELEGWGQLSAEKVVELNPDVIVGAYEEEQVRQAVSDRQAWAELSAVQDDRVYGMDPDLLSRPGPRLTEGLLLLAQYLYPEIFEESAA